MRHYDCQLYKKWHEEIIFVTRVRNNNCNNNDTYTKVVITLKSRTGVICVKKKGKNTIIRLTGSIGPKNYSKVSICVL